MSIGKFIFEIFLDIGNYGVNIMKFKFMYDNKSYKILSAIVVPFQNLFLPQVIAFAIARIIALIGLGQYFNNDIIIGTIQKIVVFAPA